MRKVKVKTTGRQGVRVIAEYSSFRDMTGVITGLSPSRVHVMVRLDQWEHEIPFSPKELELCGN
jgi:hypothetical protein